MSEAIKQRDEAAADLAEAERVMRDHPSSWSWGALDRAHKVLLAEYDRRGAALAGSAADVGSGPLALARGETSEVEPR